MTTEPKVRVLQHVAPEGPGRIATALAAHGVGVDVTRIDEGESVPTDLDGAVGLVVMGGPMGVYESDAYPHLARERRLIELALRSDLPVLGVCLGSQLLAATLGARVAPGPKKEIGWFPVSLLEGAWTDALFANAPASFTALHWHGDVFDLPAGATALARSALTPLQAYRWGTSAYGLLFHLEATTEEVATMARLFADELAGARVDEAALLARTPEGVRETAKTAETVFGAWARKLSAPG